MNDKRIGSIILVSGNWFVFLFAWKLLPLPPAITIAVIAFCFSLAVFLLWLRFITARDAWLRLWFGISPCLLCSLLLIRSLPFFPVALLLVVSFFLLGLWGMVRFYPLHLDRRLHKARYARHDELHQLLSNSPPGQGLLLGRLRFLKQFVCVRPLPTRAELGNLLIVGPTRSGKGLLATSQLLSWKSSIIVNDIKGELFAQTAGYRASLGPVFVIDPQGLGHRYNPLQGKQTEDEFMSAATHLLFKPDEGEGAIFTQRATGMLAQMFSAAHIEGIAPLPYARSLIRAGLGATAKRLNSVSPALATQFLDVSFSEAKLDDRFLLSAWGTLKARMSPLLTEHVVRCFTTSDFNAEGIMRGERPVSIYLRWPERDLLSLSPLVRLLWGSLIDELITVYDKANGKGCNPVLLLIDEAGRTAIPTLADHATTVVGRGISLWIAIQSLSQLEAVYGKPRAQVLRDNMESQIYYRPTDLVTAQYLEERIGNRSGYAHSTTERTGAETSLGLSERPVPLLTAQEILQLRDEEVLGFHRRLPPFKLRRIDWRKYSLLRERRGMRPPTLAPLPEVTDIAVQSVEQKEATGYIDPDLMQSGNDERYP